ncbi:Zinc finger protein 112 [Eumeta japonica]|uniref:Zinc finger protein 112 n=1 Tax=Eumeta variegata TaxID=151549 RepID=A0A4C1W5E6_EUMVA|nr:Zinc finger protein 112 [Eumeta japonica]
MQVLWFDELEYDDDVERVTAGERGRGRTALTVRYEERVEIILLNPDCHIYYTYQELAPALVCRIVVSPNFDTVPVDFIEHINTKKKSLLVSQNLSVIDYAIDISLNNTELPIKSEIAEESYETKNEVQINDYNNDITLGSAEYYKEDFIENVPSPDSSNSDDEPLSLRVTRKKEQQISKKEITASVKRKLTKRRFYEDFADVIILSKEQQLKEVENRKNSLNYLNSPYKCNKCYKGFLEDIPFKNHMARHEEISGEFTCEICQIRCETERKLRSHCISTHERRYACRECSHISNTCNQAREHEKWHKGHTYSCEICGQVFRKSTTRLTHVRLRHPTQHVCDVCGDSFIGSHGLTMHKRRTHKDTPEETVNSDGYCADCDFRFASKHALDKHVSSSAKHSGHSQFCHNCRMCGDAYETEETLRAHYKTHAPAGGAGGTAECDQCGAQFSNAKKCAAHHRRVHLGLKYANNKNIVCEICGKKCTSKATLQYHQRTHTGEKPYQCNVCPKRFSVRQRLQIHARTHTGERPYPCPHCPKAFRHKPALNRHARCWSAGDNTTTTYKLNTPLVMGAHGREAVYMFLLQESLLAIQLDEDPHSDGALQTAPALQEQEREGGRLTRGRGTSRGGGAAARRRRTRTDIIDYELKREE